MSVYEWGGGCNSMLLTMPILWVNATELRALPTSLGTHLIFYKTYALYSNSINELQLSNYLLHWSVSYTRSWPFSPRMFRERFWEKQEGKHEEQSHKSTDSHLLSQKEGSRGTLVGPLLHCLKTMIYPPTFPALSGFFFFLYFKFPTLLTPCCHQDT